MPYALILKTALGIAKQIQLDHPELPGDAKFGVLLDILIGIFGDVDVSKYKPAVQLVVNVAVDFWKAANLFGFLKKPAA